MIETHNVKASSNLADAIGNTPLVELQKVVPSGSAHVLAKLEFENPTGNMKNTPKTASDSAYVPTRNGMEAPKTIRKNPSPIIRCLTRLTQGRSDIAESCCDTKTKNVFLPAIVEDIDMNVSSVLGQEFTKNYLFS